MLFVNLKVRIFSFNIYSSTKIVVLGNTLTLKTLIATAADDILKYFFLIFQGKKVLIFHVSHLLIVCLADDTIHMK